LRRAGRPLRAPGAVQTGTGTPTAQAAATGAGSRHAVLHDFCMSIPYGSIAAAGGLVSLLFGAGALGWQVAAAGAAVLAASVLSLKTWKAGGSSLPFTLASAGARARGRALRSVWLLRAAGEAGGRCGS
jgi:hypothetical protein